MAHDVFISHSSEDKAIADAITAFEIVRELPTLSSAEVQAVHSEPGDVATMGFDRRLGRVS